MLPDTRHLVIGRRLPSVSRKAGVPTRRRLLLTLWFGALLFFAWPSFAWGYIDPATTSYLIQIVAGLVITLSVVFGVFFGKLRMVLVTLVARVSALFSRLGARRADDPARVEPTRGRTEATGRQNPIELLHVVPPSERAAATQKRAARPKMRDLVQSEGLKSFLFADKRPRRQRLLLAALASLSFAMTYVLFIFLDRYLANAAEMPFPFHEVLLPTVLFALVAAVVPFVLLALLPGRVFDAALTLLAGITLAGYIQAGFLNLNFGKLNGVAIPWENYRLEAALDLAFWLLLFAALFVLHARRRRAWQRLVGYSAALLIVVQATSLAVSFSSANLHFSGDTYGRYLSYQGAYTVSSTQNQYVFVLDMLDKQIIEDVRAEDPHFFDRLDGFTEFTNNISHYRSTFPSVVNLLTGAYYSYQEPAEDYYRDAYRDGRFLPSLREQGYSTNIYATRLYAYFDISEFDGLADNMQAGPLHVDTAYMLKNFLRLSLYCNLPQVFKPWLWFDPVRFEWAVSYWGEDPPYVTDDKLIYDDINQRGLTVGDEQPRFSYFHLQGPHPPFVLTRDVRYVGENQVSRTDQAIGSFKVVFAFLDALKQAGAYDNATIVITGDHGINYLERYSQRLDEPTLTALFAKPQGRAGVALDRSDAPVAVENLRGLMLRDAGVVTPPEPGYFDVPEHAPAAERIERRHYWTFYSQETQENKMEIFSVLGDANDWHNWTKLDEVVCQHMYG